MLKVCRPSKMTHLVWIPNYLHIFFLSFPPPPPIVHRNSVILGLFRLLVIISTTFTGGQGGQIGGVWKGALQSLPSPWTYSIWVWGTSLSLVVVVMTLVVMMVFVRLLGWILVSFFMHILMMFTVFMKRSVDVVFCDSILWIPPPISAGVQVCKIDVIRQDLKILRE